MHSVSDLTTTLRKTSGDVPPKLVGASTTVVGDKMYLFGGRTVTERTLVSHLYILDLESFVWKKFEFNSEDEVPTGRYFHSMDAWNNMLVLFGGMGQKPGSVATDDLCVLNDVRFFDLASQRWLPAPEQNIFNETSDAQVDPILETISDSFVPRARYAHLSSVTGNRLFIIGGQDVNNVWLDDVVVFDLSARKWVQRREYPRHSGTYRSVAVAGRLRVRFPAEETTNQKGATSVPGSRFKTDKRPSSANESFTSEDSLIHLPYSAEPTDEYPNDIYVYSNYNFTDVKRELEVFTLLPGEQGFELTDRSNSMTGTALPPGLRFPSGAICGTHLIFAGTYLAHSYQAYSIWALDLQSMTWTRLEPGSALGSGSWFRSCLWSGSAGDKLIVLGNRSGNLIEDYNRRLLCWDDVAVIDLEVFGIYQPPRLQLEIRSQVLGLAALEENLLADFEMICDDGRRISCSRQLLEKRWPWFREQRKLFLDEAHRALEKIPKSASDVPLPPGPLAELRKDKDISQVDPRLTPRSFLLSEPYPITLAFLQYFYTLGLVTPLQHAPAVLSQLMLLSATYNLPHLQELVKHAMHRALTPAVSVGVYEVATLCSCQSLQIRALKFVMSSSRRAGNRQRGNSSSAGGNAGGGGGSGGGGGHDGGDGGGGGSHFGPARPRGASQLNARRDGAGGMGGIHGAEVGGAMGRQLPSASNSRQVPPLTIPANAPPTPASKSTATTSRQRVKHSANLSMDSIYQALKSADEELTSGVDDLTDSAYEDTESEAAISPARREEPVKQPKRVASHSALRSASGASTPPVVSRPGILRTTSHSSLYDAANGPRPSGRFADGRSLTQSSSSSSLSQMPRLGIPGASDSDTPSLSYSSRTSTISSFTSSRSRPSPLTPDSPPLKTPITPIESIGQIFGANAGGGLSSIDESSIYEETLRNGSRGSTPVKTSMEFTPKDERKLSWTKLQPSITRSRSPLPNSPDSPKFSTFPSEGSQSISGGSSSEPRRSESSNGAFSPKSLFSSKSTKEKLRKSKGSSHEDGSSSMWHDSSDMKKAAKAEEKRRKKEEEKLRLEQLAANLRASAEKAKAKDTVSMVSSGSSERRKAANQWVENSEGMYGGIGGWSSL